MKFDQLTHLITEASKKDKYAKLIIGEDEPIFTPDDILRDPNDPSKGSKLYLAGKEEDVKGLDSGDPASVRRQLRRLNWIARKLIKMHRNKTGGITFEQLSKDIADLLEQYQTKVLKWGKPDKANTGYEARVIGNILLPPTKRYPQGKSVFIVPGMAVNAGPEDDNTPVPVKAPKSKGTGKKKGKSSKMTPDITITANEVHNKWLQAINHLENSFDDDLKDKIIEICMSESSLRDIMKDETIEDVYTADEIKEVLKGLVAANVLSKTPGGYITNDEEEWYANQIQKAVDETGDVMSAIDEFDPDDIEDVVDYNELGVDIPDEDMEDDYIETGDVSRRPSWWVDDEDLETEDDYGW